MREWEPLQRTTRCVRPLSSDSSSQLTKPPSSGLRVAAIFVILVTSAFGTLFPIVCRRVERLRVHEGIYAFAKYFGSGGEAKLSAAGRRRDANSPALIQ